MAITAPRAVVVVLAAALGSTAVLESRVEQSAPPSLRIASPTDDAYVSGPVRLEARVDPPMMERAVTQLLFFAGGKQVCTLTQRPFLCEWDSGERVAEHQIRAVAVMRDGTRLVQTVRTKGVQHSEVTNVDAIQVTAVVTDGDGRFVKGLKAADFKVFEDDRPQEITHFAAQDIPLELVAAIDISSSMTEALPGVKTAAKQFLRGLQPADQVTVLGFNENIFTLARRATDAAARERAVDLMAPWGGTALYDVILKSVDALGRQTGRRAIVLFSDGDDQSSHVTLDAAVRRAEGSDATIYAIGQGRAVRSADLQRLMRRLSAVSGGRAFFTDQQLALETIFNDILEDLRSQYLLTYAPVSNARDGTWHDIRVEVKGGHAVRARQGYRLMRNR